MFDLALPTGALALALVVAAAVLGLGIVLLHQAARGPRPAGGQRLLGLRILWLTLIALLWAGINVASLGWARPTRAETQEPDETVVTIEARAWSYQIVGSPPVAGRPVRFVLRSLDVLHSLGVYAPDGRLLFTLMLMPGMEEDVRYTFTAAGRYRLRCLEFCGIGHSFMAGELVVEGPR